MNGNEIVKMTIDADIVRQVVEKQVVGAIVAEFGKVPNLIESVVSKALRTKVDRSGKVSDYSSANTHDWIDILCQQSIRDSATKACQAWIAENNPAIITAVKKELNTKRGDFVKMFVDTLSTSLKSAVNVNCTINLENKNR